MKNNMASKKKELSIKELAKAYAKIAEREKAIKAEKAEAANAIKSALRGMGLSSAKTNEGMFSICNTGTWSYSKKVKEIEATLEERKEYERENEIAKFEASETLRFTAAK